MTHEKDEKIFYEGTIDKAYKKKTMLKLNLIMLLFVIIPGILIYLILILYFNSLLVFLLLLFFLTIVVPYFSIDIPVSLYLNPYVRGYFYKILENHILIHHGVFTKKRVTIPYTRIQNINIVNGVFDRIYKTYTIKIETAGSSGVVAGGGGGYIRPEGLLVGIKDPYIIEKKIKESMVKHSQIPSGLEDKIFKPQELAFDNFISYILSKMREGERLQTSIKALREQENLTASQLAEKVGVPVETINYLEEGKYNPSLTLAYKIAKVLNCKIEELFKIA